MTGSRLVVAADGGNSKTDLVLATTDADVLALVTGPGTHPQVDGVSATAAELAELTRSALGVAGLPPDTELAVGSYYLANVDLVEDEQAMYAALLEQDVAERVEVGNDTFAVLEAGSRRGWGVAVVCGAGINAVGLHADGRRERFLGIGSFSGDWGGGWSVAAAGIGAAVRAVDGRGAATALIHLVSSVFGADPETVAIRADRGEITGREVLGFAPVVLRAATDGDPVATGIAHRLADEVAAFATALLHRMNLVGSDAEIVFGGGILQSGNRIVHERIAEQIRELAPEAQLCTLQVPPVAGSLASALRLADAGESAITRARTFLQ
jgi:N-acetylglucosamine kinase-like BadF-type ATPase